jgi:chorismate mutase/prephenate dehydratase
MELKDYRQEIDRIDGEILALFQERMHLAAQIGNYKKDHGLPIFQPQREEEKLNLLQNQASQDLKPFIVPLYTLLFQLSRRYQEEQL